MADPESFADKFPYLFDRRLLIKWIKGKVADGHIDDIADTMLQQIHEQKVREAMAEINKLDDNYCCDDYPSPSYIMDMLAKKLGWMKNNITHNSLHKKKKDKEEHND